MTEIDYKEVLQDVRQAWRIVAAYQQRIIHLLASIEAYFPDLVQVDWAPVSFSRPPSRSKKPSERWAWDGLPYYHTKNTFTLLSTHTSTELNVGDWFLVVEVQTDTGFDAATVPNSGSFKGPDPINMSPVEQTESRLHVRAYCVTEAPRRGLCADDIRNADEIGIEDEGWFSLTNVGAKRIYRSASLADLFKENGEADFFSELRTLLRESGANLSED